MSDPILSATEIVCAFVSHNSIPANEVPELVRAVVAAFNLDGRQAVPEASVEKLIPAVPVKKSVHHDYIVSLETGERFQTLKRHLFGLNLTPEQYRDKWNLPHDYPMTARGYSERRSALAKSLGLGRKAAQPVEIVAKQKKPRAKQGSHVEAEAPASSPDVAPEPTENQQQAA